MPRGDLVDREVLDRLVEQPIEIEFRRQMQEHGAEADGGAVHEHELARHRDRAPGLERLMHPEGFLAAVFGRLHPVGDGAHAIVEQRAVDEPCPDIERIDQLAVEPLEAPGLVGMHDERRHRRAAGRDRDRPRRRRSSAEKSGCSHSRAG